MPSTHKLRPTIKSTKKLAIRNSQFSILNYMSYFCGLIGKISTKYIKNNE